MKYLKTFEDFVNEARKTIPKFNTGWEIISYFDEIAAFKKYRNNDAEYDDIYFEIPSDVFSKELGWTKKDIEKISANIESYEGSIYWETTNRNKYKENTITVIGGA